MMLGAIFRCRSNLAFEQFETRCCLSTVAFLSHSIELPNTSEPTSLFAVDVDRDGDVDLISSSSAENQIAWHENTDGFGRMTQQPHLIADEIASFLLVADLDVDGDPDVVASTNGGEAIGWYENTNGRGAFGGLNLIANRRAVTSLHTVDIDGDGDIDVLSSSRKDHTIAWYENTDGLGSFTSHGIAAGPSSSGASFVFAADIDGDGDVDVLSSASGADLIAWYENEDGQGTFSTPIIIARHVNVASAVNAADLDGDGDIDVLSSSSVRDTFGWHENVDGSGTFADRQVIGPPVITHPLYNRTWLTTADIDSDGDLDVLARYVGPEHGEVWWLENLDGRAHFGPPNVIAHNVDAPATLSAVDGDGDGDLDVLVASAPSGTVTWYEHRLLSDANGDGQFDQLDIVLVLQVGKYQTGQNAAFDEGDWNRDGVFDRLDIVAALQAGTYRSKSVL